MDRHAGFDSRTRLRSPTESSVFGRILSHRGRFASCNGIRMQHNTIIIINYHQHSCSCFDFWLSFTDYCPPKRCLSSPLRCPVMLCHLSHVLTELSCVVRNCSSKWLPCRWVGRLLVPLYVHVSSWVPGLCFMLLCHLASSARQLCRVANAVG